MSKKVACSLFLVLFVTGIGLFTLVSPAEAAPPCTYYCDQSSGIATICCWEWIPKNPNCKGKGCPGEYGFVCWTEPCDPLM